MLGDFFTKPLQGTQLVRMRSKILNLPSSSSTAVHKSVLEQGKRSSNEEEKGEKRYVVKGGPRTTGSATRLNWSWAIIGGKHGKK